MKKGFRIIDQLRKKYPDDLWCYVPGKHIWFNVTQGWHVVPKAQIAPRYDGDDDNFLTSYYRSDTDEKVDIIGQWLWIGGQ